MCHHDADEMVSIKRIDFIVIVQTMGFSRTYRNRFEFGEPASQFLIIIDTNLFIGQGAG
jgi:hypothetical protein